MMGFQGNIWHLLCYFDYQLRVVIILTFLCKSCKFLINFLEYQLTSKLKGQPEMSPTILNVIKTVSWQLEQTL